MTLKYNEMATASGALIVSACGFDSVPSELGMVLMQKIFSKENLHLEGVEAFLSFPKLHQSYSGHATTWDCAVMGFANQGELGKLRKELKLAKIPGSLPRRSPLSPVEKVAGLSGRLIPFMGSDASIVRRSQHSLVVAGRTDLQPAKFNMYAVVERSLSILQLIVGGIMFTVLTKFNFGQTLLKKFAEVFSFGWFTRAGPSLEAIKKTSFAITFKASGKKNSDDSKVVRFARVTGPEPGYDATSKIMTSCAEQLLTDRELIVQSIDKKGGVLTTAKAFRDTNIFETLERRGILYEEIDN